MNAAGERYLTWFYDAAIWKTMSWCGVRTLKLPSDMWNYQEIIYERAIQHVVEAGTRHGGSALFFAQVLPAGGLVISIDIDDSARQVRAHDRILFLLGSSADPDIVEEALERLGPERGPLFLILDSDHSRDQLLGETARLGAAPSPGRLSRRRGYDRQWASGAAGLRAGPLGSDRGLLARVARTAGARRRPGVEIWRHVCCPRILRPRVSHSSASLQPSVSTLARLAGRCRAGSGRLACVADVAHRNG